MLNSQAFVHAITAMGEDILWYKATPCSCYNPSVNYDAQSDCELCNHGQIYRVQPTVQGIVANNKRDMIHPQLGFIATGELMLTVIASDARFEVFDRIVLSERIEQTREVVELGYDTVAKVVPVAVTEVSDSGQVYTATTDYSFNAATGVITWVAAPTVAHYAVEYTYRPEFWWRGASVQPPGPTPAGGKGLWKSPPTQQGLLSLRPPEG